MPSSTAYYLKKEDQLYKVDMESLLALPLNVYWKDSTGIILGCNDLSAATGGLKRGEDAVGLRSIDLIDVDEPLAKILDTNDMKVVTTQKIQVFIEFLRNKDTQITSWVSNKIPMHDAKGHVVGTLGMSISTRSSSISRTLRKFIELGYISKNANIALAPQNKNLHQALSRLTKVEAECLNFLLQGLTVKECAMIMNCPRKTIEIYSHKIKKKLNCHDWSEVESKFFSYN